MKMIDKLMSPRVSGQLRHLLSTVGGVLAMHGAVDGGDWEMYVGCLMALIAFMSSWRAPEKQA